MAKLLEQALEVVRRMPLTDQDTIAQAILSMAKMGETDTIDPAHLQDVDDGLMEIARGDFASDEEVAEAFRSFVR